MHHPDNNYFLRSSLTVSVRHCNQRLEEYIWILVCLRKFKDTFLKQSSKSLKALSNQILCVAMHLRKLLKIRLQILDFVLKKKQWQILTQGKILSKIVNWNRLLLPVNAKKVIRQTQKWVKILLHMDRKIQSPQLVFMCAHRRNWTNSSTRKWPYKKQNRLRICFRKRWALLWL